MTNEMIEFLRFSCISFRRLKSSIEIVELCVSQNRAPFSLEDVRVGRAYDERRYSASGQMLRRTLTDWAVTGPMSGGNASATRNPRVTKAVDLVLDTGGDALAETTTYGYDTTYQFDVGIEQTSLNEFDFSTVDQITAQSGLIDSIPMGALVRTSEKSYLDGDSSYRNRNLLGLVTSTRVKNATGTIVAQSSISYDQYSLTPIGSVASWTDPQTPYRGNATTMSRWLDTTGAYLQTHAYYDQFGNVRTAVDAKGNQSQVDYSSTYQYAYPTTTTTAVPDPSGQYGSTSALVTTAIFDSSTGLVLFYDGTPSTPWLVTDTYYDSIGRVSKVSNPYRVSSPSAAVPASCSVCTTTGYDALNRVLTVTTADSAQVVSSYTAATSGTLGTITTVTDQAGRKRRSLTDALGRLARVDEPNKDTGNLDVGGASTSYTYDLLDNLRKVDQGGQQRFFMYDSLSRLIRAKNPEQAAGSVASNMTDPITGNTQWSMAYGYDNNGNLTARVDARNVTTSYAYDALNRNFSVTYSDGATPAVYRYYDSATNGRGRLYWDQAVGVSANVFDAYDAVGRPTQYHQRFWVNGAWGQYFNIVRTYDKAGHVLTQTYPSGHTASYGYDIVSLSTVAWATDQWNWNRGVIVNYYATADLTCPTLGCRANSGPDNNGNLKQSQYFIPTNDQMSSYNWTEDRYAYDFLNRLKSVAEYHGSSTSGLSGQDFTQVNNYDRWGNRTIDQSLTSASVPHPNYTADTNTNRLIAPAGYTYSYDPAGNQTSDNYTGQGARTYDAENRMKQAWANNQWQTYTYDADGRRIKRNVGVETWQVYGMDGELLAEYQSGAAAYLPATEYGYRGGELLTTISSGDTQRLSRFVTNLYYGALQRDPTAAELQDKTNQLAAAGVVSQSQLLTTATQIARSLFTSTNYETSPYRSDIQYVTDLYYAYLQRGPDQSGLDFWAGQAAGSRANVCNAFEASSEFQTLVATLYGTSTGDNERTEHFVNNFYLGAYGRNATATELQQQRDALNTAAAQGQSQVQTQAETMGRTLFAGQVSDYSISDQQFVTNLYEGFLQRGPDAGGLGFWTSIAAGGSQNRQNVLNAFATCGAFRELSGTLYPSRRIEP